MSFARFLNSIDFFLISLTCDEWIITSQAWMITVVQDNLNTHTPASLYKAFKPEEARRIMNRLDFCYTPKHGSW